MTLNRGNQRVSRKSVFYHTEGRSDPLLKVPNFARDYYPSMLIDDVTTGIMPSARSDGTTFKVSITPPDLRVEKLVTASLAKHLNESLIDVMHDFFRECAQVIMTFGLAAYEIAYLFEEENKEATGFRLFLITPRSLINDGKLIQYVPADVAEKLGIPRYIELPRETTVLFEAPISLRHELPKMMESLSFLSREMLPRFALPQLNRDSNLPFDAGEHTRLQKLAVAQLTKSIGWDVRGLLQDEVLEYYQVYRWLMFQKFEAELRNSILSKLNGVLLTAGNALGFSGKLKVEGLPTTDDAESAISHLEAGDQPFDEIMRAFRR